MSFGDETGEYSSIYNGNFNSVDSKKFNNKLSIDDTYAEIYSEGNIKNSGLQSERQSLKSSDGSGLTLPEYATIDINKKREARRMKTEKFEQTPQSNDDSNIGVTIYEDIGTGDKIVEEDNNIYELVSSDYSEIAGALYDECIIKTDEEIYAEIGN